MTPKIVPVCRRGLLAGLVAMVIAVAYAGSASARDARISSFAGVYQGSGVAEGRDNVFFTVTARDLDVVIRPTDDGFDVTWTTISHGTTRGQRVVRRSETVSFVAAGKPGVFRPATQVEPLSGAPYYWARVAGPTLTVYALILAENGAYELATWGRTLTANGMDLTFRRLKDGEAVRTVRGKLLKVAP